MAVGGLLIALVRLRMDITERKQVTVALRESEKRSRMIFDHSNDAIFVIDPKRDEILEVNPKACDMLGFTKEELLSKHISDIHPDEMSELHAFVQLVFEKGEGYTDLLTCQRKDGRVIPMELSASVIDLHGRTCILAMTRDITRRKQAEEALQLTQFSIDRAADPTFFIKPDGHFFYVNEAACQALGYSRDELLSMAVCDIAPDMTPESWLASWKELKQHGFFTFESRHRRKDGSTFPVEVTRNFLAFQGKEYNCAFARDITERKQLERILRSVFEGTSEATGERFLNSLVQRLAIELNTRFAFISELADLDGKNLRLLSFWTGTDFGETFTYDTKNTPCEHVIGKELVYYPDKVQERFPDDLWLREAKIESYLAIPLFDISGNPLGHMGVMHVEPMDETIPAKSILRFFATRASAEMERYRADSQLKASLREKEILLQEVHHRVKNNLQLVSSLLNLQSTTIKDQAAAETLLECRKRIKSMAMIHETLYRTKDLSKVNLTKYIQNLTAQLFSASGINASAVTPKINANNLFMEIDTAIPCGLIINELVSNALKHAFPAGQEGEIRIELHSDECQIHLIVSDDGIGFPKDFDLRNPKSLGLQLVTRLTDQLKGTIQLEKNGGSVWKMTFPRPQKR